LDGVADMTFACRQFYGGGGGVVSPLAITDIGSESNYYATSASFTLTKDGGISSSGTTSTTGPNWFSPLTSGIGSSYWARVTVNSGTSPDSGTVGSAVALSSNRTWTWNRSASGSSVANITVDIASDAGMVSIVATVTFVVTVTVNNAGHLAQWFTIGDSEVGSTAQAGMTFVGDGTLTSEGNTTNIPSDWYGPDHPAGVGIGYWIKCHNISAPALIVGSYETWRQIGAGGGIQWRWERSTVGTSSGNVEFSMSIDGSSSSTESGVLTVTVTKS